MLDQDGMSRCQVLVSISCRGVAAPAAASVIVFGPEVVMSSTSTLASNRDVTSVEHGLETDMRMSDDVVKPSSDGSADA